MSTASHTILFVGAFNNDPSIYTYAQSFVSALESMGHTVIPFNYRTTFVPGTLLFGSIGTHLNQQICNQKLIQAVHKHHPTILFLLKAEHVTAATLTTIKKHHACKIINFYPDNPFTLWNGNSTAHVVQRFPLCDCFLSWATALIPQLKAAGCSHVCHFPFAYDEKIFSSAPLAVPSNYTTDLCFIGTWEPAREEWLSHLCRAVPQYSLAIWGNDWQQQCRDSTLKKCIRGKAVYNDTVVATIQASKIVLNFIREQNMDSHNMRTFEVPASGAFLLTQRTHEQAALYFTEGESITCFTTPQELVEKITFYMTHEHERCTIARNGLERVQQFTLTKQLHSYFNNCPLLTRKG